MRKEDRTTLRHKDDRAHAALRERKYSQNLAKPAPVEGMAMPCQIDLIRRENYVPARDNPQENVRPGADDHLKYRSAPTVGSAVYRDRGHK